MNLEFNIDFLQGIRNQLLQSSKIEILMKNDVNGILFFDFIRESKSLKELKIILLSTEKPVTIPKGSIPQSVETLILYAHDQPDDLEIDNEILIQMKMTLEEGTIPNSVKTLEIDHLLFRHHPNLIPESVEKLLVVKYLEIKDSWDDGPVTNCFPLAQTEITDLKIRELPIEYQIKPGSLPNSLKSMEMEYSDNSYPLIVNCQEYSPGVIPSSLDTLKLNHWSDPTQIFIPPSVKLIKLSAGSRQNPIIHKLPQFIMDLFTNSNSIREIHLDQNSGINYQVFSFLSMSPTDPYSITDGDNNNNNNFVVVNNSKNDECGQSAENSFLGYSESGMYTNSSIPMNFHNPNIEHSDEDYETLCLNIGHPRWWKLNKLIQMGRYATEGEELPLFSKVLKSIVDSGKTVGYLDSLEIVMNRILNTNLVFEDFISFIEAHSILKHLGFQISTFGDYKTIRENLVNKIVESEVLRGCLKSIHPRFELRRSDIELFMKSFPKLELFAFFSQESMDKFRLQFEMNPPVFHPIPPNLKFIACPIEDYKFRFLKVDQIKQYYNLQPRIIVFIETIPRLYNSNLEYLTDYDNVMIDLSQLTNLRSFCTKFQPSSNIGRPLIDRYGEQFRRFIRCRTFDN
eukprot:gene8076-9936_t